VLGLVGFVASGFFFIGIIAGGVVGGALGWLVGKRIKKRKKRNKNLKHIDLFIISIGCYIKIMEN
jgi:membrane protein YqaA with SNARE-associated domain